MEKTQLTGAALAAEVAKRVMGWQDMCCGQWMRTEVMPGGARITSGTELKIADFRPDLNIAQAWTVKDRMISLGYDFDYEEEPSHNERPIAGFVRGSDSWYVQHESGATAICLASLRAIGAQAVHKETGDGN